MSELTNLKKSFNPLNQHGIWGHNKPNAALEDAVGTLVIAKDGAIPFVLSKLIAREVRIDGNVEIADDVTIRRVSEISGTREHPTVFEQFSLAMDYTRTKGSTLKEGAGFAHGAVSEYATWGAWSFANIAPTLNGTAEQPITVQDGAYIGPGVSVPKGAEVHANNYYLGNPAFILNKTDLNPETFVPTNGWDNYYAGIENNPGARFRPITLNEAQLNQIDADIAHLATLDESSAEHSSLKGDLDKALLRLWRLDRRTRYLSAFTNVDTTQLADIGVEAWIANQNRNKIHRPTLSNWLWFYHQTQHIKQVMYQQEAAKQHGDIVWHNAPLQSEVLHLARAQQILVASGNHDVAELQNLIKAKLFLLGAYPLKVEEHAALNDAFLNANRITSQTQAALGAIRGEFDLSVRHEATIDHALGGVIANPVTLTVDAAERARLSTRLGQFASVYAHVPEAAKALETSQNPRPANSEYEIPAWILAVNEQRKNFITLADGPHVRSFGGHVPVIEDGATLLGNVDISGAVHLEPGVTLKNGSVASEQSTAPVAILGKAFIEGAITHTATKEQYPVFIDGRVGPVVIKGGHIHGAEIDGYTYSEEALLSDESFIRGVVAKGAMNVGQGFAGKDGNLVFEGSSPSKNVASEGGEHLANYQQWWNNHSEFKGVPMEDDAVKQRIAEIHTNEHALAQAELADKVREHGPIYKISAPLQAAIFNLKHGAEIFDKIGDVRNAAELRYHAQGIEYLLGARETLSVDAAQRLEGNGSISRAVSSLRAIANRGETIKIDNWADNASPYAYTRADAQKLATSAHRPVTELAQRNFDLADKEHIAGKNPTIKHAMSPHDAIRRGLYEHTNFYPNHITLIAQGIDHIPTLIGTLRKEFATQAQLTAQNRNGVAAPLLTL